MATFTTTRGATCTCGNNIYDNGRCTNCYAEQKTRVARPFLIYVTSPSGFDAGFVNAKGEILERGAHTFQRLTKAAKMVIESLERAGYKIEKEYLDEVAL
jgi:hypothetical protein